jgi:Smg protein|tara:strand:+ start:1999 stop:2448 length:450 start_codon:yes stop_codon:yes gene_type:complete
MLDLLIYLFENYISTKPKLNMNAITVELEEAGFNNKDISSAFDWFNHLEKLTNGPELTNKNSIRVLSHKEYEKISKEGFTFLTFLLNAKILNPTEFEVILDQIMILNQKYINIDEMRWIVMMTLWKSGKENSYLFVEDSLFHNKRTQLH